MRIACCAAAVALLFTLLSCGSGGNQLSQLPASGNPAQTAQVAPPSTSNNDYSNMANRWIVVLKPGQGSASASSVISGLQNPPTHYWGTVFTGFAGVMTSQEVSALRANPLVKHVSRDEILYLHEFTFDPPDDPWGIPDEFKDGLPGTTTGDPADDTRIFIAGSNTPDWGVERINAFPSPGNQGGGVSVAIMDTGIDIDHPDLASAIVAGYDAYNDNEGIPPSNDTRGHGTHVAGIVGARDNGIFTSGVAPQCSLVSVKLFTNSGGTPLTAILNGLNWIATNQSVVDPPIRVANMSIGGSGTNESYYDAIQACVDLGVVFAVSAGNESRDASEYKPARFDNVITVSAMRRNGSAPNYTYNFDQNYSNFGNCVDLIAPGTSIVSSDVDGTTSTKSGTSMASPHVAGMIALWLDDHPEDGFTETLAALIANGETGNWGPDPDGVYEPLAYANEDVWIRPGWWMRGHDPQHTGRSEYVGAQTNNVKWSYTMGGLVGISASFASDGTIYIGSDNNNLYAVNPDGSLKWSYSMDIAYSGPAVGSDGTIYIGSGDYNLYAINPDGSLKWKYLTGGGIESSPAIGADGTVYVGSYDGKLYAINPDGSFKWSYTTAGAIASSPAIGSNGTVYFGSYDYKLYAINPDGSFKWSYTTGNIVYSSPAIGADGTLYVGSDDTNLYAIYPDGSLKWTYTGATQTVHASPAIAEDGTVYFGSHDNYFYAVNPDGSLKWTFTDGNCGFHSSPSIGADGTVYTGSNNTHKIYALNPDGSLLWSYTTGDAVHCCPTIGPDGTVYSGSRDGKLYAFGPPAPTDWVHTWGGTNSDYSKGVTLDSSGNVYVAASTYFGAGSRDVLVLKYGDTGNLLWQRTWGTTYAEIPLGIEADSSGNTYLACYGPTVNGSDEAYVVKFSNSGALLWQHTWGGTYADYCQDIAVDSSGDAYVTGHTSSFGAGNTDSFVLKYDSAGTIVWQRTWGGSGSEYGYGIAVDGSDNVYATGSSNNDVYLIKLDTSGNLIWQRSWGSTSFDIPRCVTTDGSGNVYLAGYTGSFSTDGNDVLLLKFDSSGNLLWQQTWGNVPDNTALSVAVDSTGSVYTSGNTMLAGINTLFVLKCDGATGNLLYGKAWAHSGLSAADVHCLATAPDGSLIFSGGAPDVNGSWQLYSPIHVQPNIAAGTPTYTLGTPAGNSGTPSGITTSPTGVQDSGGGNFDVLVGKHQM